MKGNTMEFTIEVPDAAAANIRHLRRENAKFRIQRNEARAEVARLQAELETYRNAVSK
jgi:hypothetical protein